MYKLIYKLIHKLLTINECKRLKNQRKVKIDNECYSAMLIIMIWYMWKLDCSCLFHHNYGKRRMNSQFFQNLSNKLREKQVYHSYL